MDQFAYKTKSRTVFIRMEKYCNLIQEVTPKDSNYQSQLHQDMVHKVSTLQKHAKDIQYEYSKLFAKEIEQFLELNTK